MREILFRGKSKDNGKWVYGDFCKPCNIVWVDDNISAVCDVYIQEETLGQYTGLKDKNGTKIFEGDIVKTSILHDIGCYPYSTEGVVEVKYIEGCFYPLYDYERGKIEVIGNIHDNPELLEETND